MLYYSRSWSELSCLAVRNSACEGATAKAGTVYGRMQIRKAIQCSEHIPTWCLISMGLIKPLVTLQGENGQEQMPTGKVLKTERDDDVGITDEEPDGRDRKSKDLYTAEQDNVKEPTTERDSAVKLEEAAQAHVPHANGLAQEPDKRSYKVRILHLVWMSFSASSCCQQRLHQQLGHKNGPLQNFVHELLAKCLKSYFVSNFAKTETITPACHAMSPPLTSGLHTYFSWQPVAFQFPASFEST